MSKLKLNMTSFVVVVGLVMIMASCKDPTASQQTQIAEIVGVGCQPNVVTLGSPLVWCLLNEDNPRLDLDLAPAGQDSFTIMLTYVTGAPDSSRFLINIYDSLDDVTLTFISNNYLSPGDVGVDTLVFPPFNQLFTRRVEVTLVLTRYLAFGASVAPLADTTLVWNIIGSDPPEVANQQNRSLWYE